MADKVSTIRFKAEGTQEIVSRADELTRAIQRQQRELANSVKTANQGGPGGADAMRLAQQNADQLTRLQAMRDKEKQAQFDRETEVTDAHLRGVVNRENAERAAIERTLARQSAAMDKSAEKQYAAYAKSASEEVKLDARAARAAQKATAADYKERIALSRDAAAADEKDARTAIDNVKRLYRSRAAEDGGAGGALGLRGFGGRMVIARAAGQLAEEATGDSTVGRLIGATTGAAMFGGPAVAAIVGGMELVGIGIENYRKDTEAAKKATLAFATAISSLTNEWSGLGTTLIKYGGFGQAMEKEFQRASDAALKARLDLYSQIFKPTNANDISSAIMGRKSEREIATSFDFAQIRVQEASADAARTHRDQEYKQSLADQQKMLGIQQAAIPIAGMQSGLVKSRLEMENKIAQREQARKDKQGEETRQSAASIAGTMAGIGSLRDTLAAGGLSNETRETLYAQLRSDTEKLNEARAAAGRLPGQQGAETASDAAESARDRAAQAESEAQALIQQQYKTNQATVQATVQGYAQKLALQKLADQEELRQAAAQGGAILIETMRTIAARDAAEAAAHQEVINQAQARANEAKVAATTDEYHRARAVKDAGYKEEQRQADLAGTGVQKQQEIANRKAADERAELEDQQHRTDRAILSAENRGYAEQKALRDYAYAEELKAAKAKSEALYQLKLKEIEALKAAEMRANREAIQDAMASFDPASAVGRLHRQLDEYKARGASPQEVEALRNEALTGNLNRQIEHDKIELALKTRKINQMQADALNAMVDNPLARAKGAEGDQVRKAIVEEARLKYMIRGEEPYHVGQATSRYESGYVDIAHLNMDRQVNPRLLQERANHLAERTLGILEHIAANGGLG